MSVKPIPDGYHTVTPCLIVKDADKLIDFMQTAFNAEEISRFSNDEGKVAHAEVKIGNSMVMVAEASEAYPPIPSFIHLYVEDTDAVYARALQAGAESVKEPADQFYGDRSGGVRDAFGNQWWIGTHLEEVSEEEIRNRMEANTCEAQSQAQTA